ncbi:MAG: BamA/TamA family outer membrane protein [bacterium]|nr:BamA/TamA family outer membrane protein [bacterium]
MNFLTRKKPVSPPFTLLISLSLLTIFPFPTTELFADSAIKRRVREIEIFGNERSKKETILSDLTFSKGDFIRDKDIDESRQKLMNTELFSSVLIEEIELEVEGEVTVRVELREKWAYLPLPIFVRTSDGETRTGLSYEDYNFKGRAYYLKFKWLSKWADDYDKYIGEDYSIQMQLPDFLRKDSTLSFRLSSGKSLEQAFLEGEEISRYKESTEAYSMTLGRSQGDINASISYSYARQQYKHLEGLIQPYVDINTSSVGISVGLDTVNNLGSYIYEGYSLYLSVGESNEAIGSDVNATTYSLDLKQFIHIGVRKNLAYRLKGAFITGEVSEGSKLSVGGGSSLRGYESGEYEGDRIVRFNSEYRFPVTGKYFGGVLFLDGAYAWPEEDAMAAEDMKWGAGLGLRIFIERLVKGVGRIDYAYNLSRHESIAYVGMQHTF